MLSTPLAQQAVELPASSGAPAKEPRGVDRGQCAELAWSLAPVLLAFKQASCSHVDVAQRRKT